MRACSGFVDGEEDKNDPGVRLLPGDGVRCDIDVLPFSEFDPELFKREYHLQRPVIYSRALITPPSVKASMETSMSDPLSRGYIFAGSSIEWAKKGLEVGGKAVDPKVPASDIVDALEAQKKDFTVAVRPGVFPIPMEQLVDRLEAIYTDRVTDPGQSTQYDYAVGPTGERGAAESAGNNTITATPGATEEVEKLVRRTLVASAVDAGVLFHRDTDTWYLHGSSSGSSQVESQGYVHWFLYHKGALPPFYHVPRIPISQWKALDVYPHLHSGYTGDLPIECVTSPGDVIYIPEGWWQSFMAKTGPAYMARVSPQNMQQDYELQRRRARTLRKTKRHLKALGVLETMLPQPGATRDAGLMYELGKVLAKEAVQTEFAKRFDMVTAVKQDEEEQAAPKFENIYTKKKSGKPGTATYSTEAVSHGRHVAAKREIQALKKAALLSHNRSCDSLYAWGLANLKAKRAISAKRQAIQCVKTCARFSKCYDLLSQAVLARNDGVENVVSIQASELAVEYAAAEKKVRSAKLVFKASGIKMKLN